MDASAAECLLEDTWLTVIQEWPEDDMPTVEAALAVCEFQLDLDQLDDLILSLESDVPFDPNQLGFLAEVSSEIKEWSSNDPSWPYSGVPEYCVSSYRGFGYCWLECFPSEYHKLLMDGYDPVLPLDELIELVESMRRGGWIDENGSTYAYYHLSELVQGQVIAGDIDECWGVHSTLDRALMNYVSPINQQTVEGYFFPNIAPARLRIDRICPFAIPPKNQTRATELSIPWSNRYGDVHPHPIHAALRRRQLHEVLPKYVKGPCTLVSFGDSNAAMLEEHVNYPLKRMNPVHDIKDLARFEPETLTNNVFTMDPVETPYLIALDNGHYFSPANVASLFYDNPKLMFVVLTHVFPLSSLVSERSPEPNLYTFKVEGDNLWYVPEGDVGGAYWQPKRNPTLLAKTIQDLAENICLHGSVVDSVLNSHVQVWTRFHVQGLPGVVLNHPNFMEIPRVFRSQPKSDLIPVSYYRRLMEYGLVVGVKEKDLWGKLRQFADGEKYDLTLTDKVLLIAVVYEVLRSHHFPTLPRKYYQSLGAEIWYKTFGHLGRVKTKWFEKRYFNRYRMIVDEPSLVQIVPFMDLFVNMDRSSYQTLAIKVPADLSPDLWVRFKTSLQLWWRGSASLSPDDWEMVTREPGGEITMRGSVLFLPLTNASVKIMKPDEILVRQAQHFKEVFGVVNEIPVQPDVARAMKVLVDGEVKVAETLPDFDGRPILNDQDQKLVLENLKQPDPEEAATVVKALKSEGLERRAFPAGISLKKKWDIVFPLSVDRRHKEAPYPFTHFPKSSCYPKQDCLVKAIAELSGRRKSDVALAALAAWPVGERIPGPSNPSGWPIMVCDAIGCALRLEITVLGLRSRERKNYGVKSESKITLRVSDGHVTPVPRQGGLQIVPRYPARLSETGENLIKVLPDVLRIKPAVWYPEFSRAEAYVRELIKGTTGLLGRYGVNLQHMKGWEDQIKMTAGREIPRQLIVIEGDPGCRKSSAVQATLKKLSYKRNNAFQVALPTNLLNDDWKTKLDAQKVIPGTGKGLPDYYCTTFEKALSLGQPTSVFVTDEDKFPYGYMALKALLYPDVKLFVRLGDRYQSTWHEPNGDCLLNNMPDAGEGVFYANYAKRYLIGTWRFGPSLANLLRIPTFSKVDTDLFFSKEVIRTGEQLQLFYPDKTLQTCNEIMRHAITIWPGDADVRAASCMNESENMTMSSSQGRGEDVVILVFTEAALKVVDYRTLYTAMTRAKRTLIMCFVWSSHNVNIAHVVSHPVFSKLQNILDRTPQYQKAKILPSDTIDFKKLIGELPRDVKQILAGPYERLCNVGFLNNVGFQWDALTGFIDPDASNSVVGHTQLSRSDPAFSSNSQFLTYVTPLPKVVVPQVEIQNVSIEAYKMKTHLPTESRSAWIEHNLSQIRSFEGRELVRGQFYSEQFPDRYLIRADADQKVKVLYKARSAKHQNKTLKEFRDYLGTKPDAFNPLKFDPTLMNWGQDQHPKDDVSFMTGVEQRIRFSSFLQNQYYYETKTNVFGPALFDSFKRCMGWVNPIPWNTLEFEDAIITFSERRAGRSQALKKASLPRSEPDFKNLLTAKRQLKLKDDFPPDAKPLQTILLHGDEYLFAMGPLGVYMLDKILEHCPPHVYLHAKKTFAQLDEWCRQYVTKPGAFTSDISFFDYNCDHNTVKMFELLMRFLNVPEYLIEVFLESKSHVKTQFGVHFFATFSGEIFTWLINTVKELAREFCKYAIPYGAPVAGTGDDHWRLEKYGVRPEWQELAQYDHSIEKSQEVEWGELASYILTPVGAIKDPTKLLRRLLIAEDRGKLADVYSGYFLEFLSVYNKSEAALPYLTEDQITATNLLASEFFNLRRRAGISLKLPKVDLEGWNFKVDAPGVKERNIVATALLEVIEGSYTDQMPILNNDGDEQTPSFDFGGDLWNEW